MNGPWPPRILALLLGIGGGYLFHVLGLPLAWLLGALSACLIATVAGVELRGPGKAAPAFRAILGVAIGAAFTPAIFDRLVEMTSSLALIPPFIIVVGGVGYVYFKRVAGYTPETAFFAAMPGGFQDMVAMGEARGADVRILSLIHATRVVILVFLLPLLIEFLGDLSIGNGGGGSQGWPAPWDGLLLFVCGAAGWWMAARLGISGASIIGPMVMSAVLHISGVTEAKPPILLINMAQLVIGVHIGCQYQGATLREIGRAVGYSLGFMAALLGCTAIFGGIVITVVGIEPMAAILAFSPGGQAEMNLIALVLNIDVAYIALHHLFRVLLVIVGAQFVFRFCVRR